MVMRILPQVQQDPQRSPAGQVDGRVAPMRDATASQIADIGEGMVNLGQNVTRAADIFQDNLDIARSAEAENRLRDVIREQMEAPETGYFNTVGMDAAGDRRKRAFDAVKAAQQDIDRSLDNNAQKNNFRDQASRMLSTVTTIADRHQQREVVNARIGQMKARSLNSLEEAAKLVGTDAGEIAKGSGLRDIDDYGAASGMSPDEIRFEKLKWTTALHETVVRGIVQSRAAGYSEAARAYLDKNIGEVSAARRDELGALVQNATDDDHAAQLADFFEQRGSSMEDAEITARQLYERKEITLAVRDGAIDRHRARLRNQQADRERARAATLREAADYAQVNRTSVVSFDTLPPEMKTALQKSGGVDAMRLFFERGGQRITTAAGQGFMADVASNPAVLRRFGSVDAMQAELFNDLDADDMQKLSMLYGKVTEPGKPSDTLDDGQVTTTLYLKMRGAGLIPDDATGKSPEVKQQEADRAKRLQLAVELEAKNIGGENWRSRTVIEKAWSNIAGQTIYDASDKLVPMAMLSDAELNNAADPAYWNTSSGVRVEATAIDDAAKVRAAAAIREYNEDAAAWNLSRGLKPGDPAYMPMRQATASQIAEELGKERRAAADKAAAEKRAADAAEAERIKVKGRYRGPMQDTFGSPWGRR